MFEFIGWRFQPYIYILTEILFFCCVILPNASDNIFRHDANESLFFRIFAKKSKVIHPYILLYKTLLPKKYRYYMQRAGGDRDMCHETLLHGTFYEEYTVYDFAHKTDEQRRLYLTDALRDKLCRRINSRKGERIIADKYLTYKHFHQYYHRHVWFIDNNADYEQIAEAGMCNGRLVAKPPRSCGGNGVHLITASSIDEWKETIKKLKGFVVEEPIVQDDFMSQWNSSSVNTVRMNTILRNGEVKQFAPFLRTGRIGSFVDNGAKGGLFASIDAKIGIICTCGYDENGDTHESHPDSGTPYLGIAIPQWQALLDLTSTMALSMPDMVYIGWDMALTPNGWEPVEANRGEFIAQQITLNRGLRREFEEICGIKH